MMLDDAEIGIALFVDGFAHSPTRAKQLFLELDEGMSRLGIKCNRLAARREGKPGGYQTYKGLRPKLVESDFSDVQSFTLESRPDGRNTNYSMSWRAQACVHQERETAERTNATRNKLFWMVFPDDAGVAEAAVLDALLDVARSAVDEYGYIIQMRRAAVPPVFDMDMGFGGEHIFRTCDEFCNRFTWTRFGVWTRRLLRDTFPVNFLDRSRLDLPIEGTTLEKWIFAKPDERGTVEPFNGRVWMWKPVIERIPFIREPLFRAGILHWYGFFMIDDYTQRHVPAPPPDEWFKIPDQTPDMFLPDRYFRPIPKLPPWPLHAKVQPHEPCRPDKFLGHDPKITN